MVNLALVSNFAQERKRLILIRIDHNCSCNSHIKSSIYPRDAAEQF